MTGDRMTDDEHRGRLEAANTADPQAFPWGVRTADPWPAGLALFFWYETETELRHALLRGDHAVDADDETRTRAAEALEAVLSASSSLSPDTAQAGNEAAYPAFNILWWGTFDDLCSGDHEVANDAREAFLESHDEDYDFPEQAPPIPAESRVDFAAFIREWGV